MNTRDFFLGALSSVVASACVYIFALGKNKAVFSFSILKRIFKFHKRFKEAGLSNFYRSRNDYHIYREAPTLFEYLSLATKTINIAAYWMAHGNEAEGITRQIVDLVLPPKNLTITIAIINPKSSYIKELAEYLGIEQKELVMRIESTLVNFQKAKDNLPQNLKENFILKVYKTIPIASVIILDSEESNGRIQLDFKPYRVARQNSFGFEFKGKGNSLFDLANNSWINMIKDADIYDSSKHLH